MAITLGLVEAIDSNGVYVSMPGSRGVLRGPYLTLQDVAVGDRVLTVTTDDGETVIVGMASAAAPRSTPATSTDNTVPRFDGTGGALQTSGVTVDDSNNVTGVADFTTSKASNFWRMNVTSGNGNLYLDVASGAQMAVMYRTGNSNRWFVGKTSTSESGSNAGSNFLIYAYNDSGGGIGNCLEINRSSRRVTISNAATTAGIELGSSGPTITTGTGAPSHSAPNGSIYLRQDGTAATTLYIRAGGAWSALT